MLRKKQIIINFTTYVALKLVLCDAIYSFFFREYPIQPQKKELKESEIGLLMVIWCVCVCVDSAFRSV